MQIRQRIRDYVTCNFYVDGAALSDDDSLLARGVIDSTGVMEVIQFLERDFGVRVEDAEILPENLDSISRIAAFVEQKLVPQAAAAIA